MTDRKEIGNLTVTEAPHIKTDMDTQKTMLMVLAALTPSFMMGVYIFGADVAVLTGVCVGSAVFFEWAYEKLMKKESTIYDFSAMVTGAILAFNLPAEFPLWMAVIGTFVAIVIVKQLYGGLGKNIANPAIVARIVLLLSFTKQMTTWPLNDFVKTAEDSVDTVTGATPLGLLADGSDLPGLARMFMGFISGSCGEVSAAAILIGGLFLIWKKVISPGIPLSILGTIFAFSVIYYGPQMEFSDCMYMAFFHLLAGGAMFGAFFCATDYVTSPIMNSARICYGIGIGLITMIIRLFGSYPEGMSFAILFMNVMAPLLDRAAIKAFYGDGKKKDKVPADDGRKDKDEEKGGSAK